MTESTQHGYEFFEHTADVGLRAFGSTREELFLHAARGLVELLIEDSPVASTESKAIRLQEKSIEELLKRWLKELLFTFHTEHFLPAGCTFDALTDTELRGSLHGERFDPAKHRQGTEVKGVTSHQFHVQQTAHGWEASVIFDV